MPGTAQQKPEPYDEREETALSWPEDPFDKYLPSSPGFITDFVYYLRGTEIPTAFTIWATLFGLATVVKREVWLRWGDDALYPNLYVIFVGPAGVKKSAAISKMDGVLSLFSKYISDRNIKRIKTITVVRNKATPESLLESMIPSKKGTRRFTFKDSQGATITDNSGQPMVYEFTSAASIVLPEMSVMISRSSYAESMIQNLMDLYDCQPHFEYRTVGKGLIELKNLFTCFIAATTPDGFSQTIPKAALGDGFISRCSIVYQKDSPRVFQEPLVVPGAPNKKELAQRLAWIAENNFGEHVLSEAAYKLEGSWYRKFRERQSEDPNSSTKSRMQIMIRKVAILMKIQRYSASFESNVVTEGDMKDALKLIEATFRTSPVLLEMIDEDQFWSKITRIREYLQKKIKVQRATLMQNTKTTAGQLNAVLDHLLQEGVLEIHNGNGEIKSGPSKSTTEEYWYVGNKGKGNQ
jgi:hypothetical protein